jgi:opacity protein-like surface antigen
MKKALALIGLAAGISASAMAADVTGYIIDQMCSGNAKMRGDVDCANKCIKGGSPAVLVTDDGKVYKITEQAKVIPDAGKKVMLTGKLSGDTISVENIKVL